jgi:hypothetical protein
MLHTFPTLKTNRLALREVLPIDATITGEDDFKCLSAEFLRDLLLPCSDQIVRIRFCFLGVNLRSDGLFQFV